VVAVTGVIDRAQAWHRALPWVQGVAGVTEIMVRHRVVPREPGALRRDLSKLGGGVLAIILNLAQRQKGRKWYRKARHLTTLHTP
jgi:hypothetical protein